MEIVQYAAGTYKGEVFDIENDLCSKACNCAVPLLFGAQSSTRLPVPAGAPGAAIQPPLPCMGGPKPSE